MPALRSPWSAATRPSQGAAAELAGRGVKAIAVTADVTDKQAVSAMAERVVANSAGIDILVNNAGINIRKPPHTLDPEEWDSVIETNLTSAFLCSQAAYPAMKAAGGGKIINIGSMMSIFGAQLRAGLCREQGRHRAVHPRLRLRLGGRQHPGQRHPAGLDRHRPTKRAREQVDGLHERVLARTPAARWGGIDDFAGIAVFLASPASDFVTGTAIPVDGGYSVMG